jgi:hypothetical protein
MPAAVLLLVTNSDASILSQYLAAPATLLGGAGLTWPRWPNTCRTHSPGPSYLPPHIRLTISIGISKHRQISVNSDLRS